MTEPTVEETVCERGHRIWRPIINGHPGPWQWFRPCTACLDEVGRLDGGDHNQPMPPPPEPEPVVIDGTVPSWFGGTFTIPAYEPAPVERRCGSCEWFDPLGWAPTEEGRTFGLCRAGQPVILQPSGSNTLTRHTARWPEVASDDWCGSFTPTTAPDPEG